MASVFQDLFGVNSSGKSSLFADNPFRRNIGSTANGQPSVQNEKSRQKTAAEGEKPAETRVSGHKQPKKGSKKPLKEVGTANGAVKRGNEAVLAVQEAIRKSQEVSAAAPANGTNERKEKSKEKVAVADETPGTDKLKRGAKSKKRKKEEKPEAEQEKAPRETRKKQRQKEDAELVAVELEGAKGNSRLRISDLDEEVNAERLTGAKQTKLESRKRKDNKEPVKTSSSKPKADSANEEQQMPTRAAEQDEPDAPVKKKRKQGTEAEQSEAKRSPEEEAERLQRTIFVGNLPKDTKPKVLKREFAQYGEVESIRLRSIALAESKMPRKAAVLAGKLNEQRDSLHAYVVYKDLEAAKTALKHNMQLFHGKHIRVDKAAPATSGTSSGGTRSSVEYDRTRSIFVGNLPFDIEDEDLIGAFNAEQADAVEAVRVVRDRHTGLGRGIAYVLFKTQGAAKAALALAGAEVKGRKVRVTKPGLRHTAASKQKDQASARPFKVNAKSQTKSTPVEKAGAEATGKKRDKRRESWEGSHAPKVSGRPGKGAGKQATVKGGARAGPKGSSTGPTNRVRAEKRPAVAARKRASKAGGGVGVSGRVVTGGKKPKKDVVKKKVSVGKLLKKYDHKLKKASKPRKQ